MSSPFRGLLAAAFVALALPAQDPARLNAAAEFLGGTPVPSSATVHRLCAHRGWQRHAMEMDRAWAGLEKARLAKLKAWSEREMKELRSVPTVFYPFAGPDLVHVQALYPWAETLLLVGLEPVGAIPDLDRLDLERDLAHLRRTLRTLFQSSFFITKDMERDLRHPGVGGVLPVLLVFLSRSGMRITSAELFSLDEQGRPGPVAKGRANLVRVRYTAPGDPRPRTLYYACADLCNGALYRNTRILAFARSLGPAHTYLKSASYLLHRPSFTTFRAYLLKESRSVLQDDSGLPLRAFDGRTWETQVYGSYEKPIALFSQFRQEDLARTYQDKGRVKSLDFGLGYQNKGARSNLQLARRRS